MLERKLTSSQAIEVDLVEEGTLRPYAAKTANKEKKLIYERA